MLADAALYFFPRTSLEESTLAQARAIIDEGTLVAPVRRQVVDQADLLSRNLAVRRAYPRS